MTRHQWRLFAIIATAWMFDSMDLAALTFILGPISAEFQLSGTSAGALASVSFAGMIIGASLSGVLGDRFGRRPVFTTSMIVWGLGSLGAALSQDVAFLMVCRFVIGLGMGAEFPVAQAMLSEFVPAHSRGKLVGWLEGFWPIGFITCGVLALVIVPAFGWRSIFFVMAGCSLFALIVRRGVPESPRWFAATRRFDQAEETLAEFERRVEQSSGRRLPDPAPVTQSRSGGSGKFAIAELFSAKYRRRTIMMWAVWFCTLLGYYGITTWMGKLLADSGMTTAKSIGYVVLMALWGIPGFLLASVLLERLGRKPVISGFILLSAVSAYFYGGASSSAELLIIGSIMQFFFFGMWSALYAYTPEVFSNRARATGCGTSSALGRAGALVGPLIVPVVLEAFGEGTAFIVPAAFFVLGGLIVLVLGPETKNKVLEDVSG
ncbi:MFS transporter [Prauserella oleivorans]|uniref:MFS transporter n=1 Tax=Prauserella oleivorans TaxID=1478153 RepID=A0ABW5W670_9PSEU